MDNNSRQQRPDGRSFSELRRLSLTAGINPYADGSAEVCLGLTRLLVNTVLQQNSGAKRRIEVEVDMLPCATQIRGATDDIRAMQAAELEVVSSLTADAMEAAIAQASLADLTAQIYCSVICSDGGVAGACIAGAWVALYEALQLAAQQGLIDEDIDVVRMAGISGGMVDGQPMLDLTTKESGIASFRNVFVFNSKKQLIKMQAARGERAPDVNELQELLSAAAEAIDPILAEQERAALA